MRTNSSTACIGACACSWLRVRTLVHVHVHVQPAAPACIAAKHDVEHTRSRWVTLTLPAEREIWQLF